MAEVEYCEDCGRAIGIACVCGIPFAERIKMQGINWASWSETRDKKE